MSYKLWHITMCIFQCLSFVSVSHAALINIETYHPFSHPTTYLHTSRLISLHTNSTYPANVIINGAQYTNEELSRSQSIVYRTDETKGKRYSPYVLFAFKEDIIDDPDHMFHPEETNYVIDAIKIMISTVQITTSTIILEPTLWHTPYSDLGALRGLYARLTSAQLYSHGKPFQIIKNTLSDTDYTAEVVRVIDGDTIDILYKEKKERVRLIGVDTPETVHPNKPTECFGKEASEKTKELLDGKHVTVRFDPSQGKRDRYGRLLVYLILNQELINKRLIAEGYAYEYTFRVPYLYQAEFKTAQKVAEQQQLGLWSPDTCQGVSYAS